VAVSWPTSRARRADADRAGDPQKHATAVAEEPRAAFPAVVLSESEDRRPLDLKSQDVAASDGAAGYPPGGNAAGVAGFRQLFYQTGQAPRSVFLHQVRSPAAGRPDLSTGVSRGDEQCGLRIPL